MNFYKLTIGLMLVLCIAPVTPVLAEDSGRRFDNLAWMKLAVGSSAQALGGAYTARAHDGTATYWNPAFIEFFGPFEGQITAMVLPLSLERRAAFVSYIQTLGAGNGSLGAGWHYYRIGSIEERAADGTRLGSMEDLQNAFSISYGLALNSDWKVGASIKYYLHQIAGEQGQGLGVDLAAGFNPKREWLRWEFGATLKDVSPGITWTTGRREDVYPTLRAGAAYHIIYEKLIAALDLELPGKQKLVPHAGVEWWPWARIALRFGLDFYGLHAGTGYRFGPYQIDYSYSALIEGISNEHRITVMYKL